MIIVHDIFICKPGNASKLAKMFKDMMKGSKELVNIMTDLTGQYNKVVMVSKYDSLTAYDRSWEKYKKEANKMSASGKKNDQMAEYHDMFLTGSREIYQVM